MNSSLKSSPCQYIRASTSAPDPTASTKRQTPAAVRRGSKRSPGAATIAVPCTDFDRDQPGDHPCESLDQFVDPEHREQCFDEIATLHTTPNSIRLCAVA